MNKKPTPKKESTEKKKPVSKMIGNQFWKQRSKHGRDKLFSSPDVLWIEACKYFEWCDKNPLIEVEQSKKSAPVVKKKKGTRTKKDNGLIELPLMRAYTWEGLELFLDIDSLRWYKTSESHKAFLQVITRIGKIIYTQKFTGAASGLLNPNIIARDLGLVDKGDITSKGESIVKEVDYSKLSNKELNQLQELQRKMNE